MRPFSSVSVAFFVIIIICFFMPFLDLSCSGQKMGRVNGLQLVLGGEVETPGMFGGTQRDRIDPEPLAISAFIAAVIGLLLSFSNRRESKALPLLAGAGGGVFLLLLKSKAENEIAREGMGILHVELEAGFWLTLVLFFVVALLNLFALVQHTPTAAQESTPESEQSNESSPPRRVGPS